MILENVWMCVYVRASACVYFFLEEVRKHACTYTRCYVHRKIGRSSHPSGVLVAPIYCGRLYTSHRSRWCSHKSSHYPLRSSHYSFLSVLAALTCREHHLTSKRRSRYSPRVVRAPFRRTGYSE